MKEVVDMLVLRQRLLFGFRMANLKIVSGIGEFMVPVDVDHEIQVEFGISGYSRAYACPGLAYGGVNLMLHYYTAEKDCVELPAFNSPDYYSDLQDAYDAADNEDVILSQAGVITGDVLIDRADDISVTFDGGYNCNHSEATDNTVVNGDLIISRGTVNIGNFIIGIE